MVSISPMPYKYRYRPPFFCPCTVRQSSSSDSFLRYSSFSIFISFQCDFYISIYIYMYIASNEERPFSFFLQIIHTDRYGQIERYVLSNSIINDSIFASFKFSRVTINLKYYNQLSIRNYRDVTNVLNRVWICASGSEWNNLIHRFFLESKNDIGNNIEAIASRSNVCARR